MTERTQATNELYLTDPQRPRYHFLPPKNWMNDPNGLIQWKGKYHLFYQHNPDGAYPAQMHWGHASSLDLVHWEHLPIALTPTPNGPDKDGCYSGCAVDHDGIPTLIYTGVFPEVQCLATGSDDLIRWQKYPGNPVIAAAPLELELSGFRDPCVWREGNEWIMALGAGIKGIGGAILIYKSENLIDWSYEGPALIDDSGLTSEMWECPALFRLGDKHVLMVSVTPRAAVDYFTGHFDGRRFTPEVRRKLDFSRYFYAPQTFLNDRGQRLMFGWIWEGRSVEADMEAGWSGVQSLPRVLTLRDDGYLGIEPAVEVQQLRSEHHTFANIELSPALPFTPAIKSDQMELQLEVPPESAKVFGIALRKSPDGAEQTILGYDFETSELWVDRAQSSLNQDVHHETQRGLLSLKPGESLNLRIFVDHSVLEIYANGRFCLSSRIYPTRQDSLGISLFVKGGDSRVNSLDLWEIDAI